MPNLCRGCRTAAMDEYHWWEGELERVWYLCDDCCEFACDVVELISNLEEAVERWTRN